MKLEEQLKIYKDISRKINELEEQKKALSIAIMAQMQDDKLQVEEYTIRRYERLFVKLTVEEARAFDAVKLEEVVDKAKIKALHEQGTPIEGVSVTRFIQVSTRNPKISIENPTAV